MRKGEGKNMKEAEFRKHGDYMKGKGERMRSQKCMTWPQFPT